VQAVQVVQHKKLLLKHTFPPCSGASSATISNTRARVKQQSLVALLEMINSRRVGLAKQELAHLFGKDLVFSEKKTNFAQ